MPFQLGRRTISNEKIICILTFLFPGSGFASPFAVLVYTLLVTYAFVMPAIWPGMLLRHTLERAHEAREWLRGEVATSGNATGLVMIQVEGQRRLHE